MPGLKSKSSQMSAIMFADVHGYSRLMAINEDATADRVMRAINLIRSLIGDYGGTVKNVAGDGVLALFDDATDAVMFAIEIQHEFQKDAVWNSQSDPIAFRIGINFGGVREDQSGVQGHSVNIAARIQDLAPPGGICISQIIRESVSEMGGIGFEPMGSPVLKNIGEPIEIFRIVETDRNGTVQTSIPDRPRLEVQSASESSIAVLPLENLTAEPQYAHVCKGVTGDIIGNLTRFRDLHVIAHGSSSLFQGHTLAPSNIGQHLGVRYLAMGNFQCIANRIRIQVQLIEARSGRSIWSEKFDGDLVEIFAFLDDVTAAVAARMSIEISVAERRRLQATAPSDLRAYGLILRGHDVQQRLQRESNLHARRLFEQATEVDPTYARAFVGISRTLNDAWRFDWANPPEPALDQALKQAEMAISLNPDDARAYAALGNACLYKRQYDESLASYERAIEFNPNDADILAEMGHSVGVYGDTDRAVTLIKRAMHLNPYYPDWYLWHLGEAYFDKCDYEEAIQTLNKMHDKTEAYRMLTASNALIGNLDAAKTLAQQLLVTHPEFTIQHWANVPPDRNPEPRERLIEGLRKAGLK